MNKAQKDFLKGIGLGMYGGILLIIFSMAIFDTSPISGTILIIIMAGSVVLKYIDLGKTQK